MLKFSTTEERATISDIKFKPEVSSSLSSLKKKKKKSSQTVDKKKFKRGLQVKEGQIALHIAGYPGIQVLSATELIHCIPINKIKVAAEKFLKRTGVKKRRERKRINHKVMNKDSKKMAMLPKKRDLSTMMDPQFEFPEEIPDWRQHGNKQKVMGTNFIKIKPYYEWQQPPKVIEFQLLDLDHYWAMGPNTRFKVKGVFQVMYPAKDQTLAIPWANCTTDE